MLQSEDTVGKPRRLLLLQPVLRVPVSQLPDLLLRLALDAVVPATEVALTVLPPHVEGQAEADGDRARARDQVEDVAGLVARGVFPEVQPSAADDEGRVRMGRGRKSRKFTSATHTIEPQDPNEGTMAEVTARATGLPAFAVAQARKKGPHGTVERSSIQVSAVFPGSRRKNRRSRAPVNVRKEAPVQTRGTSVKDSSAQRCGTQTYRKGLAGLSTPRT